MHSMLDREKLRRDVHLALRSWRKLDGPPESFLEYLLLIARYRREADEGPKPVARRLATNRLLREAMQAMQPQNDLGASILESRFAEESTTRMIANRVNRSVDQVNRDQKKAIDQLTGIILGWEEQERLDRTHAAEVALPPRSYNRELFGVAPLLAQLTELLLHPDLPWVVALVGSGGSGKTALANALARRLIPALVYERIFWLSLTAPPDQASSTDVFLNILATKIAASPTVEQNAEKRLLTVRRFLKTRRCLVIVDNVETTAQLNALVPLLLELSDPGKFLLTARTRPPAVSAVFSQLLTELDYDAAVALMRDQAEALGIQDFGTSGTGDFHRVIQAVGGNPLALKTVVGLSTTLPLASVLQSLTQGKIWPIEKVYQRLYARLWSTISAPGRRLLQGLLLVSAEGANLAQLAAVSGLSEAQLWAAVTELTTLCLVEGQGTVWEKRYSIPQLLRFYLESEAEAGSQDNALVTPTAANLAYWRQQLAGLDGRSLAALLPELANLDLALRAGLRRPETTLAALQLCLDLFDFVEACGCWRAWQPVLTMAIAAADRPEYAAYRCRLLIQLGHVQRVTGRLDTAAQTHLQAEALADELDLPERLAHARLQLAEDYRLLRRYDAADAAGRSALALFQEQGAAAAWLAMTGDTLGLVARARGRYDVAVTYLRQSSAYWRRTNQTFRLARSLNSLALSLGDQKRFDAAVAIFDEAAALLAGTEYEIDKAMIQLSLGTLQFRQGQLAQAEGTFQAIDRAALDKAGHLYYQALIEQNLGVVLLHQKKLAAAVGPLQAAEALWRELNDDVMLGNTIGALAELAREAGDREGAAARFAIAIELLGRYPDNDFARRNQADLERQLAELGHTQK